jgi:hypothetical protein
LVVSALVSVSEEVRSRCHVKHSLARMIPELGSGENFAVDSHLSLMPHVSIHKVVSGNGSTHTVASKNKSIL